ncbi:4-alpha-glucanotransferase, partial [Streptomyces prasinopilosus]
MHRPTSSDTPAAEPAEGLTELARLHGIDTEFRAEDGTRVRTPPHTLVAVLRALGVDATTPGAVAAALVAHRRRTAERLLPGDCVVARQGATAMLRVPEAAKVWIELEGGGRLDVPAGSDDEPSTRVLSAIPLGYHRVRVRLGERHDSAALIVCPARIAQPERRLWGYAAHLYALLSERSWGMGDLTDLADLAQWSARMHDAGFVVVNPLHAMMPVAFADHSPYWPSDRCFPDPVHVRVEDVPEYRGLDTLARRAVEEVAAAASELRRNVMSGHGLVERDRVWDLKRRALRTVYQAGLSPERAVAYRAFLEREGERLDLHATWWALADRYGPDWRTWPAGLSDPGGPEVARARERYADDVDFRRWLVWVTDEQMAGVQRAALDAGMPIGVIHDLSVGVHPSGAEAWSLQHCLASGITVGAPPDVFNAQGQDWCLPPWRPDALAAHGYEPYARVLRGVLRHAGALRLDHAMGLFRLWWVPEGRPVSDGTYVRYDHEAMLAVLTLEAHRAGTPVIGEDLGTVEPEVRTELSDRGILGTSMLWMERSVDGYGGSVPRRAG